MRAFISLELPEEIRTEINKIQKTLKGKGIQARWVKPEITHLTLAFLGPIAPEKTKIINSILQEATNQVKPIKLKLHQLGCFPSLQKPQVIFVSLQGELGKLHALAIKIRKGLKKEKIWFDQKPLSAHITLGRVKKSQNLTRFVKKAKVENIEFIADKITLQKSTLTNSGPVYKKLKSFTLLS
jgi:2'-5' RNA ligase